MIDKIKDFFSGEKLILKFFSIFLAIVIWLIVSLQERGVNQGSLQLSIPVLYQNVPKNLAFRENPLDSIQISFKNRSGSSASLYPGNFRVSIDLKGAQHGKNEFLIEEKNITKPEGIFIERILPKILVFDLEYMLSKSVPIKPAFEGKLKQNYVLQSVQIFPDRLRIRGPQSKIDKINFLKMETINLSNVNFDFSVNTKVSVLPEYSGFQEDLLVPLLVKVSVSTKPMTRKFKNVPIELKNSKFVTKINPKTANLLLYGPEDRIKTLSESSIKLNLDLESLTPGKYKLKPTSDFDPVIQVKQIWPVVDVWILDQQQIN